MITSVYYRRKFDYINLMPIKLSKSVSATKKLALPKLNKVLYTNCTVTKSFSVAMRRPESPSGVLRRTGMVLLSITVGSWRQPYCWSFRKTFQASWKEPPASRDSKALKMCYNSWKCANCGRKQWKQTKRKSRSVDILVFGCGVYVNYWNALHCLCVQWCSRLWW